MIIRIDSIDNIIQDLANVLHLKPTKMLEEIGKIDFDNNSKMGFEYVLQHKHETLTEIYLCHLTRHLKNDDGKILHPLKELLLNKNEFSSFLQKYKIQFVLGNNGDIELFFKNQRCNWENKEDRKFNVARFRSRLSQDFCVNGFQFLYDIKHSCCTNYSCYMQVPEFIYDLECLLKINLVNEYQKLSSSYVALCRLPVGEVLFARAYREYDFETQYLYHALNYIWEYMCKTSVFKCATNPILCALDNISVPVEAWITDDKILNYQRRKKEL